MGGAAVGFRPRRRPDHTGAQGFRRRAARAAAWRADGGGMLPAPRHRHRHRAGQGPPARAHPQGHQARQYPGGLRGWKGAPHWLRHRVTSAARAPGARAPRVHRRQPRLYGARTDRTDEPVDQLPQRFVRSRHHALPNAYRRSAVYRRRSDGMGPLPYRTQAGAACRAGGDRAGRGLRHDHEAARQDGRGALPDGGRGRARSAALPGGLGHAWPRRPLPARRAGRARPAVDSRETVRASPRGRNLARRLRPGGGQERAGAGAGVRLFRHRQVLGRQRAAQSAGAAARAVRVGQVRPVQARHPLCDSGAGVPGPDPPAAGQERCRAGAPGATRSARRWAGTASSW